MGQDELTRGGTIVAPTDRARREGDEYEVGRIEQRGIDVVPASDRHGKPRDLFWVWLPANVSFLYIFLGGVLLSLGLNIWQAVLAVLVGNAFYYLIGVCATPGPRAGTSTLMISRAQYGLRGNQVSTAIWWFNLVAFEAINFSIGTLAAVDLVGLVAGDVGDAGKAIILAAVIAVTIAVVVYGYDTILRLENLLGYALGIGAVALGLFILPDVDWSYAPQDGLSGGALIGLWFVGVTIIAAGPLSWCGAPADFARYLPSNASPRAIAKYTALGAALPSVFLAIVAILAGTVVDMSNPTTNMRPLMPEWFYPVFLALIVVGSICNNVLGIYSSGLSIQTLGLKIKRHRAAILHGLIGTAMTVYALFISDFIPTLTEYLQFAMWWYAPFVAIMVVDLWLRGRGYDGEELHRPHGRYWYRDGVNWNGLAALAAGALAGFLTANTTLWQSPISTELLYGADISSFTGLLVGGLAYWMLNKDLRAERHALGKETSR